MVVHHQSLLLSPFLRVASLRRRKALNLLQVSPGECLTVPRFVSQARLTCMATIQMQTALIIQLRSRKAKEAVQTAFLFDNDLDHPLRKTIMIDTELTLDQLQTFDGGAAFIKLGDIKGEYCQVIHLNYRCFKGDASGAGGKPKLNWDAICDIGTSIRRV